MTFSKRNIFSITLPIGIVFTLLSFSHWTDSSNHHHTLPYSDLKAKQRGAHIFGVVDSTNAQPFLLNNIEWITLVSWGYQDDFDSPYMTHHDGDSVYMIQHDQHWVENINKAQDAGFKVFFKPHLWITQPTDGKWRSDIYPKNEENWKLWKESYRNFILRYAHVAERAQAEMFCIGAEFTQLAINKPTYWRNIIQEIRSVYSGQLTYAANWYKEYEKVDFWDELDYIGIQAYFPLVKKENPSLEQISIGWQKPLATMESLHRKYSKPILFTEMGYKSTSNSAITPWEWLSYARDPDQKLSHITQSNCYEAFFKMVWKQPWFAGVHIWQLRSDYNKQNAYNNLDFTPQGKPAEKVIAKGFGKTSD